MKQSTKLHLALYRARTTAHYRTHTREGGGRKKEAVCKEMQLLTDAVYGHEALILVYDYSLVGVFLLQGRKTPRDNSLHTYLLFTVSVHNTCRL